MGLLSRDFIHKVRYNAPVASVLAWVFCAHLWARTIDAGFGSRKVPANEKCCDEVRL